MHTATVFIAFISRRRCALATLQAKEAINHPYFDDLDKATVDLLENPVVRTRDAAGIS